MSDQIDLNVGGDFLADALGEHKDPTEGRESAPAVQPDSFSTPDPEPPRSGGYAPLIEQKRKEVVALEEKIENQRETGAYMVQGEGGQNPYFDYVRMQEDQVRIGRLNREIGELRAREQQRHGDLMRRNRQAQEIARSIASQDIPRLPEKLRKPVRDAFVQIFQTLTTSGEWGKSIYADRDNIRKGLMQMMDTAVGTAHRQVEWTGAAPSGGPAGEPQVEKPGELDEDDFTNNLMYAFERRQRRSLTVAEAKAAERAAAAETGGKA